MSAITIQRHLITSRLPSRMIFRICHFSTNRQLLAVGRAPKVKKLERERKREAQQKVLSHSPPQEFPTIVKAPTSLLVSAIAAGQLSISGLEALNILKEFDGVRLKSGTPKDLCLKYKIDPRVLTQLARTLLVVRVEANFKTAHGLLLAATELEDPGAALMLVLKDLKNEREGPRAPFLNKAHQILEQLVRTENPSAIYVQGRIYERKGKHKLALEMYVKSTEISTDAYTGADVVKISLGDAWTAIARLRRRGNDIVGAEEALKKAAIDYDNSAAYLQLATKMTDPLSDEYEKYLLKAAVSDEPEAAGELGAFYFKKLRKSKTFVRKSSQPSSKDSNRPITMRIRKGQFEDQNEWELWTQAFEWLSVAAESQIASSQIYYAIMCRALQKPNVGLKWLDEASKSPRLVTSVAWLKEMWFSNELDLSDFDLDEILQNKDN